MLRECFGGVCVVAGHGQTLEYFVWEGLPLSWVVKLMVVIGWSVCVVGVVGDLGIMCVALDTIM